MSGIDQCLLEWKKFLKGDQIVVDSLSIGETQANTLGVDRAVSAVLYPRSQNDVVEIIKIASTHKIKIYPVSTGKNWGYGCSAPVESGGVVLNLSRMDRIIDFDSELGVVTLEPGVTAQKLYDYLQQKNLSFMVPTTGAGPTVSIVGNALERGYGLAQYSDHFQAVLSLKAVMADGNIYEKSVGVGREGSSVNAFKWGVGPYIDGLFTQSNMGVVIEMSVALAPTPARCEVFFLLARKNIGPADMAAATRDMLHALGGYTMINLMNRYRLASMITPYLLTEGKAKNKRPFQMVDEYIRRKRIPDWVGMGLLGGDADMNYQAKKLIKKKFRKLCKDMIFVDAKKVRIMEAICGHLPGKPMMDTIYGLKMALQNISGIPNEVALKMPYWKTGGVPPSGGIADLTKDGCGLIWYSPLVPLKGKVIDEYIRRIESVSLKYDRKPLITLTSLSPRCFDSTIPILFDKEDPDEVKKAHDYYNALYDSCAEIGILPYRVGIHSMDKIADQNSSFWKVAKKIKQALDPDNTIAPGRYSA